VSIILKDNVYRRETKEFRFATLKYYLKFKFTAVFIFRTHHHGDHCAEYVVTTVCFRFVAYTVLL